MTQKLNIDKEYSDRKKEGQQVTAPKKNWRFSASYDSFVVQQTFVLRINICGKNRQLLLAANRYLPYKIGEVTKKLEVCG
jgi:hypothetical protein